MLAVWARAAPAPEDGTAVENWLSCAALLSVRVLPLTRRVLAQQRSPSAATSELERLSQRLLNWAMAMAAAALVAPNTRTQATAPKKSANVSCNNLPLFSPLTDIRKGEAFASAMLFPNSCIGKCFASTIGKTCFAATHLPDSTLPLWDEQGQSRLSCVRP